MTTLPTSSWQLSLGKAWQGAEPWICLQATFWQEGANDSRHRGYLIIDLRKGQEIFRWSNQKPESTVSSGPVMNLMRKYLLPGRATGLVLGTSTDPNAFVALIVASSDDQGQTRYGAIKITQGNPHELELILEPHASVCRWTTQGTYTVRKDATACEPLFQKTPEHESALSMLISSFVSPPAVTKAQHDISSPSPFSLAQREARDRVARRLKTLKKTWTQEQRKLPSKEEAREALRHGELIKNFIHRIKPESTHLNLSAEETGDSPMVLELDPNMSPGAQMNKAFAKARRLERGLVMGQERATKMKTQMDAYQSALDSLRSNTLSLSEIEVFLTRLGLAARQTKRPQAGEHTSQKAPLLGRRFTSSDGALMIVGRTAHENDEITRRAKSGDWWFHTSGSVHGAHVVVPVRSLPGKALTPNTQKEACILALHFSGLSLSREGEVYVTQRAQLRKRKGMPEGLWHIERTQTVVVRYESTELTQIFAREDRQGVMRVHEDGNQND